MRTLRLLRFTPTLALALLAGPLFAADLPSLTDAEQRDGWQLLFDGQSTKGWRNFKKPAVQGKGWVVEDGILKKLAGVAGGDIITEQEFDDFEFCWEWRIPPGANNGIKYFITEERGSAIGHEYQMIDDATVKNPLQQTAAFYDVLRAATNKPAFKLSDWNTSRVVARGNQVEHWLNGVKVLDYDCGSPEVKAAVAKSKFKSVAGFGDKIRGHILLTDHQDEAWFRNLKVRKLPAALK